MNPRADLPELEPTLDLNKREQDNDWIDTPTVPVIREFVSEPEALASPGTPSATAF